MREAPTKFWRFEKLIMKEGYSTNQNLEPINLNHPTRNPPPLKDSYINHDILSTLPCMFTTPVSFYASAFVTQFYKYQFPS